MKKDQCIKSIEQGRQPANGESVGDILARIMAKARTATQSGPKPLAEKPLSVIAPVQAHARETAVFDFDLAEFPLFYFAKRPPRDIHAPLKYRDTIRGKEGKPVVREWSCFPGRLGIGGATAQALLFDLLQLYAEQGGRGTRIHFGTLRSLLVRRGERNPSRKDYERLRRDFIILRGYDFSCRNAYWDPIRRTYADMDWRLFGAIHYLKDREGTTAVEQPFGFIELSPTFEEALGNRGQFRLGFETDLFHRLPPLAQRLSLYLAKMFTYQVVHRRRVEELATALPIEAKTSTDKKKILQRTIEKLLDSGLPILKGFQYHQDGQRNWWITFSRGEKKPRIPSRQSSTQKQLPPGYEYQVERIIAAVNGEKDRMWWTKCVRELGPGPIDRALAELRESQQKQRIKSPGAFLTSILRDYRPRHPS